MAKPTPKAAVLRSAPAPQRSTKPTPQPDPAAAGPARGIPDPMSEEVRGKIAQTAYYLAEQRGFSPGYELEDWLKAEKQVLERLRAP